MPKNNREWRFQSFADRFIDRVVLPPFFTTGIDHASNTTDNARARARGRGIKPGIADIYTIQGNPPCTLWLELKRGSSVSEAQAIVHHAMAECEVLAFVARNIKDVLSALQLAGFRLHGNAANIAIEIEAKLDAADRAAAIKRPSSGRARAKKPSVRDIAAFERIRSELLTKKS